MTDAAGSSAFSLRALRALRREGALLVIVVLVVAAFGLIRPHYLSLANLLNIGQQTAVIAIVAYAMTAVIICKGVDISVGSTLAASGVVAALAMQTAGVPGWLGVVLVLAVGAAYGLLNGVLVSYAGISPLVTTLAVYALARGMALSLSEARSVAVDSGLYLWFGRAALGGVPVGFLAAIVLAVLWAVLLQRTVFGRWVYATGGNEDAARASLIPVRAVRLLTYVLAGASAGAGALLTTGRVGSAQPLSGAGLEFAAITAAIIGGARLSGGHGSITGTALGALLLGAVNTGLSFLQVSQQVNYFVTGGFVIAAIVASRKNSWPRPGSGFLRRRPAPTAAAAGAAQPGAANGRQQPHVLELRGIGKRFGNVQALADVSMQIRSGQVLALVGENGAGKSTLVKLLSGILQPGQGELLLDGRPLALSCAQDSRAAGIAVIHQHFSLIADLTVAENLAFGIGAGRLPRRCGLALDRAAMRRSARQALGDLELALDPDERVARLTAGQCQMVEIAKATLADAWLIVMDEPTSALTSHERDLLYRLVARLLQRGCGVLYISHKMQELYALAQRAVVLRDGRVAGQAELAQTDAAALIRMMVGRDIRDVFPYRQAQAGAVLLDVRQLCDRSVLKRIDLQVRSGELVALTGLMGSGRTELLRAIAGFSRFTGGAVRIGGQQLAPGRARQAARLGLAYVPEDRHREGFVASMSLRDNLTLRWISANSVAGCLLRVGAITGLAETLIARLGVRPAHADKLAGNLSGGNQQKIVLGKWLATGPKLLLLDEPTNGVDVGAKFEIHKLIADLKAQGVAILMVSSELPEVLGVADRIVVLSGGRVAGELARGATEEQVTSLAFKHA